MGLPTAPFDPAKSIFAGLSVIQLKLSPSITGVTAAAATDVITKNAHGLVDGRALLYVSGTGFTGLTAGEIYYVRDSAANTYKLAATVDGAAINITVDGSDGVFQPVHVFEAMQLDDDPTQETKSIERPDAKGRLRPVRTVETKAGEKWTFGLDEVKRVLEIFDGKLRGRKTGTCTLWIPDPDDASGKVALKSQEDFAITVTRDGKITHGNSEFSKATIKIESNHTDDVTWTADATA